MTDLTKIYFYGIPIAKDKTVSYICKVPPNILCNSVTRRTPKFFLQKIPSIYISR